MATPLFSIEDQTPRGLMYSLAIRILEHVIPTILSVNNPLTQRMALAYAWFVFIKEREPQLYQEELGVEFPQDYTKWSEQELHKIANALGKYAASLLAQVIKPHEPTPKTKAPRPPIKTRRI